MSNWFAKSLLVLKRLFVALFALAQLFPSGMALASESGELTVVICTMDGQTSVNWEEFTGESSPFGAADEDHSSEPCHACVVGACSSGATNGAQTFLPGVNQNAASLLAGLYRTSTVIFKTGPPMPSRAPPGSLI